MTQSLDGIRVVEAATLFAAAFAGVLLGDLGAEVIKIEHPRRPDAARAHGPSKDGAGLWLKTLARAKRLVTLDLSQPGEPRSSSGWPRAQTSSSRTSGRGHWSGGARLGGALRGESAPRARARERLRPDRPVYQPGFGTLAEARCAFASMNRELDGPPLLPPLALADGVAGLATAFSVLAALRAREQTGRGQVVDTSLVEPLMMLLGSQLTAYDLLGELQPRTGNRSIHNAPRNVYRTADDSWVAVSASATSIAARVLQRVARPDLFEQPWFSTGSGRAAHVDEMDDAVAAWIRERDRTDVLAAFEAAEAAIAPVDNAQDILADPQLEAIAHRGRARSSASGRPSSRGSAATEPCDRAAARASNSRNSHAFRNGRRTCCR